VSLAEQECCIASCLFSFLLVVVVVAYHPPTTARHTHRRPSASHLSIHCTMNKYFAVGEQQFVELPDGTQLRRLSVSVVGAPKAGTSTQLAVDRLLG
jgi:hypothetical protein